MTRRAADPSSWLENPDGSKSAAIGARMMRGEWTTGQDVVAMGANQSMAHQVRGRLKKAGYRLESKSAGPAGLKAYRVRPGKVAHENGAGRDRVAHPGAAAETYPSLGATLVVRALAMTDAGVVVHLSDGNGGAWSAAITGHVGRF